MIHMQMTQKDVIELVDRNARGHVVGDCALAHVENESVTVAELHIDRGVHLAGAQHGRSAHERDAHLFGLDFFGSGKPVGSALEPRLWADALEEQSLFPAAHGNAAGGDLFHGGFIGEIGRRFV